MAGTDANAVSISPLVADLIQASLSITFDANDRVIDNLTAQVRSWQAHEAIVRQRILFLCSGPWAPSTGALTDALMVSNEEIEAWIAEHEEAS
jgi:hypothetical protein